MDRQADGATRTAILELINNNLNRKFFKEARLETFFQKCFSLTEPEKLMEESTFYNFVYYDLKQLLQLITGRDNLVNFTKFILFFKIDEDPELYELLSEAICKKIAHFTCDQLLTMMVNYNQTLSP